MAGGVVGGLIGAGTALAGTITARKNEKRLKKELANAPKYQITDEAKSNQALAKANAFGRDRAIEQAGEDVSRSAENAANQARDVTSSSSALLSTIAQIQGNKNDALRSLGQADAASRQQKLLNLQGVNSDMIDEKDKAWNYNVNMPFQNRVAMYRDKMKYGQDLQSAGAAASAQSFASMGGQKVFGNKST